MIYSPARGVFILVALPATAGGGVDIFSCRSVEVDKFSCQRSLQRLLQPTAVLGLIYFPARGVFRDADARVDIFTSRSFQDS